MFLGVPIVIYLQARFLENEQDVMAALERAAPGKFVAVDPGALKFEEMRSLMGGAAVVIGAHGGAMYNVFFARPTAAVIEFVPIGSQGLNIFALISTMLGQDYIRGMERKAGNGMVVDTEKLERAVTEALHRQ